jgi:hypothetical protein
METDSPEGDEFFKEIPDDQKKSIEKLSLKIKSLLGESFIDSEVRRS